MPGCFSNSLATGAILIASGRVPKTVRTFVRSLLEAFPRAKLVPAC